MNGLPPYSVTASLCAGNMADSPTPFSKIRRMERYPAEPIGVDSLGDGYGEADLRAVLAGKKEHVPRRGKLTQALSEHPNLLIDIQAELRSSKGAGYIKWVKSFNLKQMAQTLNYLTEHKLLDYAALSKKRQRPPPAATSCSGRSRPRKRALRRSPSCGHIPQGLIPEGLEVLKSWGYRYIDEMIWDKYYLGLGRYLRHTHETMLLGIRGKPELKFRAQPSLVRAPRQDHSHKPEEFFPIIERISHPPYLELFARRRPTSACPEQWDVWGNEIASDLYIPGYPVPQYSAKAVLPEEAR